MLPLNDGDVIRYRIGYACEYDQYTWIHTGEAFRGIKRFKEFLASIKTTLEEETEDKTYVKESIIDPVDHCLHSVKETINFIRRRVGSYSCVTYLTGTGNFREKIATIQPYKGNRPDRKPIHYDAITDYLIYKYKAIVVDGMEADDAMAIYQSSFPDTCIVTIDKDLLQVPGDHYNFVSDKFHHTTPWEGLQRLYQQILTGDTTDNILGIPKIGPAKAKAWLEGCTTEKELYKRACELYKQERGDNWHDELVETARLVYMLRHPTDEWSPP